MRVRYFALVATAMNIYTLKSVAHLINISISLYSRCARASYKPNGNEERLQFLMAYKKEYVEQIFSNIYLGGQLEQAVLSPTSPEPMPFSQLFIIYFYIGY